MDTPSKDFYLCFASIQNPSGAFFQYNTYAIATSSENALAIVNQEIQQQFPAGWTINYTSAGPVARELLEQIAEDVLGWQRP